MAASSSIHSHSAAGFDGGGCVRGDGVPDEAGGSDRERVREAGGVCDCEREGGGGLVVVGNVTRNGVQRVSRI
ncbi:hypothetical protein J1614_012190 [Plenodomus biglobosus]|nr:hypothetical protein J1614_012190 [Plenodomus biglobosus]